MDKKSVLIVDDEDSICSSLVTLLKSDLVETRTASTLETVDKLIATEKFDLAIVDLCFKGGGDMEGLDIISLIKARTPETQVVLFSGYGTPEIERAALARGAIDCWDKSIKIATLIERFRALGIPAGRRAG